jgi:hypothetical protein
LTRIAISFTVLVIFVICISISLAGAFLATIAALRFATQIALVDKAAVEIQLGLLWRRPSADADSRLGLALHADPVLAAVRGRLHINVVDSALVDVGPPRVLLVVVPNLPVPMSTHTTTTTTSSPWSRQVPSSPQSSRASC